MINKVWPVLSLDADGHEALIAIFTSSGQAEAYMTQLPMPADGGRYTTEPVYLDPAPGPDTQKCLAAPRFFG